MYNTKIYLIVLGVLLTFGITAQNIKEQKVSYNYIKKPLTPVSKEIKNYVSSISNGFNEENKRKQDEYKKSLQVAQENHQKNMEIYQQKLKAAQEVYKSELDAYNKRSLGRAIIDGQTSKPVLREPYLPNKENVPEPIIKTGYDNNTLASTYLYLSGFEKAPEGAVKIEVILYGFDYTAPRIASLQKDFTSMKSGVSSSSKKTYYYIEYSYRHPMAVKVIAPDGKELLYVTPQELNNYKVYKSNESESYPNLNAPMLLKNSEEDILQKNLTFINELVNDKFGIQPTNRNAILYYVKSKKEEYQDLMIAYNEASSALTMLTEDNEAAKTKIDVAIKAWQGALNESDVNNKKARIDKDVTIAVCFNLLEAYFATENIVDYEAVFAKMSTINLSSNERKIKQDFEKIFVDLKKRIIANK